MIYRVDLFYIKRLMNFRLFNLSSKDDLPKIELLEEKDEEKDLYTSNYKE